MFLALIGYRGSGKTNVAPLVAEQLGWEWVDADVEIERRVGKTIAAIFADDGEEAFRDLESAIFKKLIERDRTVLALGGGVVLRPANRWRLCNPRSKVAWLKASAETLHRRIKADAATASRRPKLTSHKGLAEIRQLLAERNVYYQQCADVVMETEGKTPQDVAQELVAWVRELRSNG